MKHSVTIFVLTLCWALPSFAQAQQPLTTADYVKALAHPEPAVRGKAFQELHKMAQNKNKLDDAVPLLKKYAGNTILYYGRIDSSTQVLAAYLLKMVRPELYVQQEIKILTTISANHEKHLDQFGATIDWLLTLESQPHNIDTPLIASLQMLAAPNAKKQEQRARYEGDLLFVLAQHARDRKLVGKVIMSRFRWPLSHQYYQDNHFHAVRACADQCGPMVAPFLQIMKQGQKYRLSEKTLVPKTVGSMALYHEDAWKYFSEYLKDRFGAYMVENKRAMLGGFAESWLTATPKVQKASLPKFQTLIKQIPQCTDWDLKYYRGSLHPYHDAFPMETFRKKTGF